MGEGAVVEPAVDFAREEEVKFTEEGFEYAREKAYGKCEGRAVRALVECVVPCAFTMTDKYEGFLFNGGVAIAALACFDDGCEY